MKPRQIYKISCCTTNISDTNIVVAETFEKFFGSIDRAAKAYVVLVQRYMDQNGAVLLRHAEGHSPNLELDEIKYLQFFVHLTFTVVPLL